MRMTRAIVILVVAFAQTASADIVHRRAGMPSVEGRISVADSSPDDWPRLAEDWGALGATHLSVNTMRAGLKTPAAHIDAIQRFYKTVHG